MTVQHVGWIRLGGLLKTTTPTTTTLTHNKRRISLLLQQQQQRTARTRHRLHHQQAAANRAFSASSAAARTGSIGGKNKNEEEEVEETDVLIVGGGVVGCALANQLVKCLPALRVGLVEASGGPPPLAIQSKKKEEDDDSIPHPRSYALSPTSLRLLGLLPDDSANNIKDSINNSKLGWFDSMQVWESDQPSTLIFDAKQDLVSEQYLGAVVEDLFLRQTLWSQLQQNANNNSNSNNCRLYINTSVADMQLPLSAHSDLVTVQLQQQNGTKDDKDDTSSSIQQKKTIRTHLLVAADGARSSLVQRAGLSSASYDYGQEALTFTVQLKSSIQQRQRRAFQRFLSNGNVLALLPTYSNRHAICVWSTTPETAQLYKINNTNSNNKEENEQLLVSHLNDLLQQGPGIVSSIFGEQHYETSSSLPLPILNIMYGVDKVLETLQYGPALAAQEITGRPFTAPPLIDGIASPLLSFPLSTRHASAFALPQQRFAIVGDAARTVHPMAGQGLNLGLQDVAALVESIHTAAMSGMDPATFLSDYQTARSVRGGAAVAGLHALHGIFSKRQETWAKHVKGLGMTVVQSIGPLRRAVVQTATNGIGNCWQY